MFIIRFILGLWVGFCFGNAFLIQAEVRRRGSWNDQDAQEFCFWLLLCGFGLALSLPTLWI